MISQQVFGCCIAKFADTKLFDTRPPIYTQGHVRAVHIRYVSAHARGLGTVVARGQKRLGRGTGKCPRISIIHEIHITKHLLQNIHNMFGTP